MDSRCSTYHRTCWTSSTDFAADTPPINAHHYGWPIVDLTRGNVPAFHVRTENPKYARIRTLQDAEVFLETERKDYRMFGPEERRRGGVLRTHEDEVRPSRALGGTYPRRGARPGRRLHPLVRPRAHQTVARLDESCTNTVKAREWLRDHLQENVRSPSITKQRMQRRTRINY